MQAIPLIAQEADDLTVFQRTANYVIPANNGPVPDEVRQARKADYTGIRERIQNSTFGFELTMLEKGAAESTHEEVDAVLQPRWDEGGFGIWLGSYVDMFFVDDANAKVRHFLHDKIREKIDDPRDRRAADPQGLSVRLQAQPAGLRLLRDVQPAARAPGRREIQPDRRDHPGRGEAGGRNRVRVRRDRLRHRVRRHDRPAEPDRHPGPRWAAAARQVGGRAAHLPGPDERGLPEPVHHHRPAEPVGAVQHAGLHRAARRLHRPDHRSTCATAAPTTIEPTPEAEDAWVAENQQLAEATLFPTADTWYMGANIPGKPRVFLPNLSFVGPYRAKCDRIAENDYEGFTISDAPGKGPQHDREPVLHARVPRRLRAGQHRAAATWRRAARSRTASSP